MKTNLTNVLQNIWRLISALRLCIGQKWVKAQKTEDWNKTTTFLLCYTEEKDDLYTGTLPPPGLSHITTFTAAGSLLQVSLTVPQVLSQNPRISEFARNLRRSLAPFSLRTGLAMRWHQVTQSGLLSCQVLKTSKDGDSRTSPGSTIQCLTVLIVIR